MALLKKNLSPRRKQLKETLAAERFTKLTEIVNSNLPVSLSILVTFAAGCCLILSLRTGGDILTYRPWYQVLSIIIFVAAFSLISAVYIYRYNYRLIKSLARSATLAGLFLVLLAIIKLFTVLPGSVYMAVAAVVTNAIILTIVYNQRFALVMGIFYSMLACIAVGFEADFGLFLTMVAGVATSSFLLREIRTRIKILEVGVFAGAAVFAISLSTDLFESGFTRAKNYWFRR